MNEESERLFVANQDVLFHAQAKSPLLSRPKPILLSEFPVSHFMLVMRIVNLYEQCDYYYYDY